MSITGITLTTIVLMALVTFATRAAGFVVIRLARPGPRAERFLQAAPRTMFVALITPALVSGGPAEWLGAATAIALMLVSKNLLASITGATVVVALVRML